jgi:predicted CopG family antitoxin
LTTRNFCSILITDLKKGEAMADVRSIGVSQEVYDDLVKIQEKHKDEHNANKTFSQIIEDLLKEHKTTVNG